MPIRVLSTFIPALLMYFHIHSVCCIQFLDSSTSLCDFITAPVILICSFRKLFCYGHDSHSEPQFRSYYW